MEILPGSEISALIWKELLLVWNPPRIILHYERVSRVGIRALMVDLNFEPLRVGESKARWQKIASYLHLQTSTLIDVPIKFIGGTVLIEKPMVYRYLISKWLTPHLYFQQTTTFRVYCSAEGMVTKARNRERAFLKVDWSTTSQLRWEWSEQRCPAWSNSYPPTTSNAVGFLSILCNFLVEILHIVHYYVVLPIAPLRT